MRIKSLNIDSGDDSILIAENGNDESNWITVITGANGTRKSLVLRLISSAALNYRGIRTSGLTFYPLKLVTNGGRINRVIAISGTPFDRFTKVSVRRIVSENNETPPDQTPPDQTPPDQTYSYFGFKSINGSTGALGISRVIGILLWRRREKLADRIESLCSVFSFLKLSPIVEVKIRRPPILNATSRESNSNGLKRGNFDSSQLRPFLQSQSEKYSNDGNGKLLEYVKFLMRSKARISKLEKFLSQFPSPIHYDFKDGSAIPAFHIADEFEIERLLDIGLLVIDDLFIKQLPTTENVEPKHISASSLSSGQWQLLLGLLGLGLEIENDSIVVIDEPENSLHPEWQRQYIELLENVMAKKKRCHVIIATHSPLLTSGVNGERGNLLRLFPKAESKFGVASEALTQNFGWGVRETLELLFDMQTTRGSGFVEMVDTVLGMIRDKETKSKQFELLATSIIDASRNLPDNDPVLQIARAIEKIVNTQPEAQ